MTLKPLPDARLLLPTALAVSALLVAACGSSGDNDDDSGPSPEADNGSAPADDAPGDEAADEGPVFGDDGVLQPLSDGFPEDSITVLIAHAPGHQDEDYGRTIIDLVEEISPVPLVLQNQPAGPRLSYDTIDYMETVPGGTEGYYVGVTSVSSMAQRSTTVLEPDDPASLEDMINGVIGITEEHTIVLAVPGDSEFETLDDMVDFAHENPGELRVATSALGSGLHIPLELLAADREFEYVAVPHDGSNQAQQTLLAGGAEAVTTVPVNIAPLLESGDVRAIYQWGRARSSIVPDAPTSDELGLRGIQVNRGLLAHPDIPPEHLEWLETLFLAAAEQAGYEERLDMFGLDRLTMGHDEAGEHLQEVFDLTLPVVEELGLASR